jgi:putative oxidoreductase
MLKRLLSIKPISIDIGLLLLRLSVGVLMMTHGMPKLMNFADRMDRFSDPYGLSSPVSLSMAIFAEVFCSVFLMVGLFTRAVLVPLIFTMITIVFIVHLNDPFNKQELGLLYLLPYITLCFTGPGKYSIDARLFKS